MPKLIDLTGKKFGKLTVIRYSHSKNNHRYWMCRCECGKEVSVITSSLKTGNTKSCGCMQNRPKHNESRTKLYSVWNGIRQRCNNKNSKHYKNYGGRGITVCEEWDNSYESFREWALNNGYKQGLEVDRIDNDKGYYPENCRLTTHKQQQSNKRTNRMIEFNGETKTLSQWAEYIGIKPNSLLYRIRDHGEEKALSLKGNLRGHKID